MAGVRSPDARPGALVTKLVKAIPPGRASTYGTIARAAVLLDRPIGGARTVAWVLAALKAGDPLPWHRVVGAGGVILLPDRRGAIQKSRLRSEGIAFIKGAVGPDFLLDERGLATAALRAR